MYRSALAAVYLAFLARGMFYCLLLPMWEGFDEWAHFSCVEHIAEQGSLPVRGGPVSDEVRASLALAPLARHPVYRPAGGLNHEEFWRLPESARRAREVALRSLAPARAPASGYAGEPRNYEAQQPPLYYLILALPYRVAANRSLAARVLLLRGVSVLIASTVIPLAFAIARRVFSSGRTALAIAALIALLPGLFIDVCRVGNDCLAIALVSSVVLSSLALLDASAGMRRWAILGALLGAACLTKAYAVALLPVIPAVIGIRRLRFPEPQWKALAGGLLAFLACALISGWWYWRSWNLTGTISGEQNDVAAARFGLAEKIAAIRQLHWLRALDTAAFSHIWVGGWSFLVVRSWMYRVFEIIALAALAGLMALAWKAVVRLRRNGTLGPFAARAGIVASVYGLLCVALAYDSVVIFLAHGVSFAGGWYLYAVVVPEVVLAAAGLAALVGPRRVARAVAVICILAAALDLYTADFVLAPYYTGLAHHGPYGIQELLRRMAAGWPAAAGVPVLAGAWIAYLASTAALVTIALWVFGGRAMPRPRISL